MPDMGVSDVLTCGCPKSAQTDRATEAFGIRRSTYEPNCGLGVHSHAEARIVLTLNGAFTSRYGGAGFALDTTHALYRPSSDEHADSYSRTTECLTITLPPGSIESKGGTRPFAVHDADVLSLGRQIAFEMDQNDTASTLVLDGLCSEVAARVFRCAPRERSDFGWMRRVHAWLESEYDDPPPLRLIAEAVDRDMSYVASAFKMRYGMTMGKFVRDLRMSRALRLLGDYRVSLADVAHRSGFADQSHFSRQFRKRFSVSPNEFRRRLS